MPIPLSNIGTGQNVRVDQIDGGRRIRAHLQAMGMGRGTVVKVINNNASGPLIVALGSSRLTIGKGMAAKILVEPALPP